MIPSQSEGKDIWRETGAEKRLTAGRRAGERVCVCVSACVCLLEYVPTIYGHLSSVGVGESGGGRKPLSPAISQYIPSLSLLRSLSLFSGFDTRKLAFNSLMGLGGGG